MGEREDKKEKMRNFFLLNSSINALTTFTGSSTFKFYQKCFYMFGPKNVNPRKTF